MKIHQHTQETMKFSHEVNGEVHIWTTTFDCAGYSYKTTLFPCGCVYQKEVDCYGHPVRSSIAQVPCEQHTPIPVS